MAKNIIQNDLENEEVSDILRVDVIASKLGVELGTIKRMAKRYDLKIYKPSGPKGMNWYDFKALKREIMKSVAT